MLFKRMRSFELIEVGDLIQFERRKEDKGKLVLESVI